MAETMVEKLDIEKAREGGREELASGRPQQLGSKRKQQQRQECREGRTCHQ